MEGRRNWPAQAAAQIAFFVTTAFEQSNHCAWDQITHTMRNINMLTTSLQKRPKNFVSSGVRSAANTIFGAKKISDGIHLTKQHPLYVCNCTCFFHLSLFSFLIVFSTSEWVCMSWLQALCICVFVFVYLACLSESEWVCMLWLTGLVFVYLYLCIVYLAYLSDFVC